MNSTELAHAHEAMRCAGSLIGTILSSIVPPIQPTPEDPPVAIPSSYVTDLTECFQIVIAEALQAWLDAGSERDVTMEDDDLYRAIRKHLWSWSERWQEES
jgi:hypothetical protein